MTENRRQTNILFRAAAVLSALFCVTVLSLIAALGGGGGSPVAKFLNENGGAIVAVEVAAILACAVGAMTVDRWRTLREAKQVNVEAASIESTSGIDSDIPSS